MTKRMLNIILLTAFVFSGCSDTSSSNTIIDDMSMANEINKVDADGTAVLPDAVSFDSDRISELVPDSSGQIICDEMGVSFPLPSQYRAYFYSIGDVKENEWDTVNSSCTHSLFIVSPYYPQIKEYVRVSIDRLIAPEVVPFDIIKKGEKALTETEYLRRVKNDIEYYAATFIAFENADMYNYIGAKSKDGYPAALSNEGRINYNTLSLTTLTAMREAAPDSSISDIKYEMKAPKLIQFNYSYSRKVA